METCATHVDETRKAMLKQEALSYLPRNLGDVDAQRQILSMITYVVPSVAACLEQADHLLWPKVKTGKLSIGQAVAHCAYECNKVLSADTLSDLSLASLSRETLLHAWIALDYYNYVLKAEYSVNIRKLQKQISDVLLTADACIPQQETTGTHIGSKPQKPADDPVTRQAAPVHKPAAAAGTSDKKTGKMLLFLAALMLLIALVSIFMLNDTLKTEMAIRKIGTVTLESEEQLLHAEQLYNNLDESKQKEVGNYEDLIAARAQYDRLVTESAIDSIGKVTLESKDAIEHAEALYAALSEEARNLVENHKTLTAARKEYDWLEAAVKNASDAIDAIGEVTLESGQKIKEARKAYDDLKKDNLQKYLSQKLPVLTNAEKEYNQLASQELYDTGMTHYNDKNYTDAVACFDTIIADYSDTELLDDARKAKADCQTAIAKQAYDKKDYYTALKTLDAVEAEYQQLENHKSLREKVTSAITEARPKNGTVIAGDIGWGRCYFKVTAGDQDMVLKIQNTSKTSKYELIYLRAGQKKTIKVADGNYSIKWATGKQWFDKTHLFGDDTIYRDNGTVELETTYKGNKVYYWYVTLDFTTSTGSIISANDF